jgi:hypothetical protein
LLEDALRDQRRNLTPQAAMPHANGLLSGGRVKARNF